MINYKYEKFLRDVSYVKEAIEDNIDSIITKWEQHDEPNFTKVADSRNIPESERGEYFSHYDIIGSEEITIPETESICQYLTQQGFLDCIEFKRTTDYQETPTIRAYKLK